TGTQPPEYMPPPPPEEEVSPEGTLVTDPSAGANSGDIIPLEPAAPEATPHSAPPAQTPDTELPPEG
ncbi:MAG TPA: hypothetical protein PLX03_06890, partial [Candidatus Hydrogenedentes bacterium]|nr:hypothetical protein [Candidatus Hydrogenedentota bacterium]